MTADELMAEGRRLREQAEQDVRDLRGERPPWYMRLLSRFTCCASEHGPFETIEEIDRVQVRSDVDLVKRRVRCVNCGARGIQTTREAHREK